MNKLTSGTAGKHRRPVRAGFTMIELVIVVLVFGILAAVGAPKYHAALATTRVEAAARRVVADLRLAQNRAISLSTTQSVAFTVNDDFYSLAGMADIDHATRNYDVDLSVKGYYAEFTDADFGGSPVVTFNWYGQPTSAGSITLVNSGQTRVIDVSAAGVIAKTP